MHSRAPLRLPVAHAPCMFEKAQVYPLCRASLNFSCIFFVSWPMDLSNVLWIRSGFRLATKEILRTAYRHIKWGLISKHVGALFQIHSTWIQNNLRWSVIAVRAGESEVQKFGIFTHHKSHKKNSHSKNAKPALAGKAVLPLYQEFPSKKYVACSSLIHSHGWAICLPTPPLFRGQRRHIAPSCAQHMWAILFKVVLTPFGGIDID